MSWYYVYKGERHGPVEASVIISKIKSLELASEDYLWTKGMEQWTKIRDVKEFQKLLFQEKNLEEHKQNQPYSVDKKSEQELNFLNHSRKEKIYFIKIGQDRQSDEKEYGPYSLEILQKLFGEKRINQETLVFHLSINHWISLNQVKGFQEVFGVTPIMNSQKQEKRAFERKPLIARVFVGNAQQVFEGICRDISLTGMQILMDKVPFKIQDEISINVHPDNPKHQFVASGKVIRLLPENLGFSFEFKNLSHQSHSAIESYLNERISNS